MTTPNVDTDQLPRGVPAATVPGGADHVGGPGAGRRALREERRLRRRQRRIYASVGLAILAAFLFATVVVLDMVR
jgi:hypothetical protein